MQEVKSKVTSWLIPIGAVIAALALGAIMLLALGAEPLSGYATMFGAAFGNLKGLSATAMKSIPLLLVGVGICISFRANVINIGGEGQMVMGALWATITALSFPHLDSLMLVPLVLLMGILGGAVWGAIPGALKAYFNVSEILSTIMLNIVAVQIMNYLLRGVLIDPGEIERGTRIPQTARLPETSDLPLLFEGLRVHLGFVIALLAAFAVWVLLWRTALGFKLRSVGLSREAARYAGIPVKRSIITALALSGAMAGLAGAILVFGSESHRMVTDGSSTGFTGSAGFNGIVVALFAGLHPLWSIPSSLLFGGMLVGANALQRAAQVPSALVIALNGLIVVFVVSSEFFRRKLQQHHSARQAIEEDSRLTEENVGS
ncbi:ABC transporter permease [Desulfopila aestuarii]|uniref:Simple sugar transport system permease protein n=1 Tax=Desulfopila aestuarii DSM 18488 TaxID=1121416 RepID=A0A1M7YAT8_9BACT|nr:ABC transporter permease [Desulfopila aestuarii]SHO49734.1 simple sugar transport system permease protein [Desulfopila aestuarii DSM 18488]